MAESIQCEIRRVQAADAVALAAFYNGLSPDAIRNFRPLGEKTTVAICHQIARDNDPANQNFDLIALAGPRVIGWCFLWGLHGNNPTFGLGIADDHRGQGLGSRLMDRVMAAARDYHLHHILLTVVKDNAVARQMYEKRGFTTRKEFVSERDGQTYLAMTHELFAPPARVTRHNAAAPALRPLA